MMPQSLRDVLLGIGGLSGAAGFWLWWGQAAVSVWLGVFLLVLCIADGIEAAIRGRP